MSAKPRRKNKPKKPQAVSAGAERSRVPAPVTVTIGSFLDLLKRRAIESIVIAVFTVGGGAIYWSWGYIKEQTRDIIVTATIEELKSDKNRLLEPIKNMLSQLRTTEIGALSVGNFVLTPSNPQYVLPIYMPKKHIGRLSVLLSGDLVPNQSYVVLMLPNGKKLELKKDETTIDLAQLVSMEESSKAGVPEGLVVQPDYINRDSPDEPQTKVISCSLAAFWQDRLAARRAATILAPRTAAEGLIWPFSLAFGRIPPVGCS